MRQRTMNNVLAFPRRRRVMCSDVSEQQVDEAQDRLNSLLTSGLIFCPACTGRGIFPHKRPVTGSIALSPCPCGGTDEDRIDVDFGGAA
ncbi:hypothetical protein AA309_20015 [Microvirga vignae]|uniref:Uncharacterized protein n=1 Tax=Microvirga vignae TaxID=1225564 RepID=A0A0H1R825_9HYPH|nr:hypothetical protein [Microvirga vignae]KLK91390.1 hypothetical protein AA309_20015 [Microvirga vignae]